MESFLRYLYTEKINEEVDCNLMILADKYNVKALVEKCAQVAETKMDVENVLEIGYSAYLINHQKLLDKASEFISNNRGSIRMGEFWDHLKNKNPGAALKVTTLLLVGNSK